MNLHFVGLGDPVVGEVIEHARGRIERVKEDPIPMRLPAVELASRGVEAEGSKPTTELADAAVAIGGDQVVGVAEIAKVRL